MNVIEQAQSEIRRKNKKLAEEEFSSLLHTSRNKKLHTKNIMILERTDEVVKEKRWVRDLNEKERMGKVVADLEVRDSHAVQESLNRNPPRSDTDPNSSNPRNWPRSKKWRAIAFASLYTFISPISSSMDLKFTQKIDAEMSLSIFPILQASLWFFVLFNAICGLSEDKSQMLLFRFLAGLGGSAPISLSGSVVADCFNGAEMGQAMSYYALGIVLAPALGPILGGIVGGVLAVFGTFFFPETYAPVLAARERKERGEVLAGGEVKIWTVLKGSITRPIIMLFTQPIVMVIALIMAFVYGVMYIVLSTFSLLFMEKYGENTQTSSLHYLALAVGLVIGSQLSGPLLDKISKVLQKRYNTPHKPEYRLPICIPGSVLLPIGLFLYGWAAENTLHWIWLDIGIALFAMSVNLTFQSLSLYTVDVYHLYSASALAAVSSLRSLAGFGFPLFAGDMYDQMGYGWGNSMLAILGIVIGIPAPILLYIYGERIRAASKFGSG
ncbi:MFS general substrate transporter [Rhizoclosmatium globosum]|uniref:MFS general substrate transporter n=1 Tax=Rhizoclosmatium globosum TaxID=329046 RepID=A0A1Y2CIA7_9FUNG|nr:MFS general substrate transporter [Rhizoclosmatium globosum]|eukprot:ORY46788.1 MFS general substrate transporter [Rhizoclosmatium globosum]